MVCTWHYYRHHVSYFHYATVSNNFFLISMDYNNFQCLFVHSYELWRFSTISQQLSDCFSCKYSSQETALHFSVYFYGSSNLVSYCFLWFSCNFGKYSHGFLCRDSCGSPGYSDGLPGTPMVSPWASQVSPWIPVVFPLFSVVFLWIPRIQSFLNYVPKCSYGFLSLQSHGFSIRFVDIPMNFNCFPMVLQLFPWVFQWIHDNTCVCPMAFIWCCFPGHSKGFLRRDSHGFPEVSWGLIRTL